MSEMTDWNKLVDAATIDLIKTGKAKTEADITVKMICDWVVEHTKKKPRLLK